MKHNLFLLISGLMAAAACAGPARAHITITTPGAVAGSYTKVVLQVPHGCAGSATRAITVEVPSALLVAKPMPKPGWSVTMQKAKLPQPAKLHGRPIDETTSVIRWEGGPLPSDFFDEFALMGKLTDEASGSLVFKTVQTCEKGEVSWHDAPGTDTPAPALLVEPAPAGKGHAHH